MAQKKNRYHGEAEQLESKLKSLRNTHQKLVAQDDDPDFALLSKLDLELEEEEIQPLIADITIKALLLSEHEEKWRRHSLAEAVERENKLPPGTLTNGFNERPNIPAPEPLAPLWEKWIALKIKEGKLTEGTEKSYRNAFSRFTEIVGEIGCHMVNKALARSYRDELTDYPLQRNKTKAWTALPLSEVRMLQPLRLSNTTVKMDIDCISGFCKWLVIEDLLPSNPLEGMAPQVDKFENSRDAFTVEEIKQVFSHPWFKGSTPHGGRKALHPWQYWVPIIALFTGSRLEEICRLRKKDIKLHNNLFMHFDFMPSDLAPELSARRTKRAGKTAAASRYIPIHHQLIALGFIDFVDSRPDGYLFDLNEMDFKRGHYAGKRINSVLIHPFGFPGKKVLHSMRHTIRDSFSVAKVPETVMKALMGHRLGDVTHGSYGTPLGKNLDATADDYFRLDFAQVIVNIDPWHSIKHNFAV